MQEVGAQEAGVSQVPFPRKCPIPRETAGELTDICRDRVKLVRGETGHTLRAAHAPTAPTASAVSACA